ncbi:MAG TPA: ABC transporter ATP-binding protein [Trueperaceae bacterium]
MSVPTMPGGAILEVSGLRTHVFTPEGVVRAVDGVDFTVPAGKTVCVVGESGCGKSLTARSIMQTVPPPGKVVAGEVLFRRDDGAVVDLAAMDPKGREIRSIRGREIAMVFQEPMTSLSPVHTVGNQIVEALRLHLPLRPAEARRRAVESLAMVGMPRPERIMDSYTFQLSGGMRQRAMIAMALSCRPRLLIADEPTTALDVTTQANILDLIRELQEELGMAVLFITHDLGVVAEMADEVVVMYLGRVVERGPVDETFHDPKHPYTRALLGSIPRLGTGARDADLASIGGSVPHPFRRPGGCPFHPRCDSFMPGLCDRVEPPPVTTADGREVRCLLYGGAPEGASAPGAGAGTGASRRDGAAEGPAGRAGEPARGEA